MNQPQRKTPSGKELLDELIRATGLPEELAKGQLESIIDRDGTSEIATMSLDNLREILSRYTQDLFAEIAEGKIKPDAPLPR
jgi:hypothetical protein